MKKMTSLLLMLVMTLLLLASCGSKEAAPATDAAADETADPANIVTIMVNIKGMGGAIEATDDGTDPVVDPEYPMQSAFLNVEKGTVVKIAAEPEEGYHFFKWTVGGAEYSTEPLISVTAEEDTEFIAEFLPEGKDGKHVDLDTVTTMGELLGLPDIGSSHQGTTFVYAFEQDGNTYRAVCEVPEDVSQAMFDLDFEDPEYDKKMNELLAPIPVVSIDNLNENLPTQEEADQYLGKTGQELMDDGWYVSFYNLEEMKFGMVKGAYSYDITFEGEIENPDTFDEYTDMGGLTVKSISCDGIGDATYIEETGE